MLNTFANSRNSFTDAFHRGNVRITGHQFHSRSHSRENLDLIMLGKAGDRRFARLRDVHEGEDAFLLVDGLAGVGRTSHVLPGVAGCGLGRAVCLDEERVPPLGADVHGGGVTNRCVEPGYGRLGRRSVVVGRHHGRRHESGLLQGGLQGFGGRFGLARTDAGRERGWDVCHSTLRAKSGGS